MTRLPGRSDDEAPAYDSDASRLTNLRNLLAEYEMRSVQQGREIASLQGRLKAIEQIPIAMRESR